MSRQPRQSAGARASTSKRDSGRAVHHPRFELSAGLLPAILALVAAILPSVVNWEMEGQAIILLAILGLLGLALSRTPQKSRLWAVEPESTWATIKQTIATMRALVTVGLTILIVSIVLTSDGILGRVPDGITQYIEPAISSQNAPEVLTLHVHESPTGGGTGTMYIARMAPQQPRRAGTSPEGSPATERPLAGQSHTGERVIHVMAAPTIVRRMLEKSFLPSYFQVAWLGTVLCSLFIMGIFFMELMSNALREARPGDLAR